MSESVQMMSAATAESKSTREAAWAAVRDRIVHFSKGANQFSDFQNTSCTLQQLVGKLQRHAVRRVPEGTRAEEMKVVRDRLKNRNAISGAVLKDDTPLRWVAGTTWNSFFKVERDIPEGERKKNLYDGNVDRIEGPVCFDLDDGGVEEAEKRCRELGIACVTYSTYNHSVAKEKARLVVFLSEAMPTGTPDAAQEYREFYDALGEALCANCHDTSCRNPGRVIYLPAWDGERPRFARFAPGGLLDPRPWLETVRGEIAAEKAARAQQGSYRRTRAQRELAVYQGDGAKYMTPWLTRFLRMYAKRFRAADFLRAYNIDGVRRRPLGGAAAHCPFGHEHTNGINKPDALWALNASASEYGVFIFECCHKTCKATRHGGHFLDALIDAHELTVADVLEFVTLTAAERTALAKRSTAK